MEHLTPVRNSVVEHVTPECNSRLPLHSAGEDSGYASLPSGPQTPPKLSAIERSVSPFEPRNRQSYSSNLSFTPELSSLSRKNRISGRNFNGRRCLLSSVSSLNEEEEPEVDNNASYGSQNEWPGHHTPTKIKTQISYKSASSPTKSHPYLMRDAPEKNCKSAKIFYENSRTPPRKSQRRLPLIQITSFSEEIKSRDPFRKREGSHYIDFLWCLGEERVMSPAVSLILSYLSAEDLIACCLVSKAWRTIIMKDNANNRRLSAVQKLRMKKENLKRASALGKVDVNKENRTALSSIQNIRLIPPAVEIPNTPPPKSSPSKFRFELFVQEGRRLEKSDDQHLKPCPRCSLPSLVDTRLNLGVCTRIGCGFRFCILCHCVEHSVPVNFSPCTSSSSPPRYIKCPFAQRPITPPSPPQPVSSIKKNRLNLARSKSSKRNLRRLMMN